MPFTPFHFGLGYAVAGVVKDSKRFSFFVFVITQVVIDIETLANIIKESPQLHTFFHTFLGSMVAALSTVILCYFLILAGRRILALTPIGFNRWLVRWKLFPAEIPTLSCFLISSSFGALSHVFLDSIMHSDVFPFAPLSRVNPMNELVALDTLHILCLGLLVLGAILLNWNSGSRIKNYKGSDSQFPPPGSGHRDSTSE